MSEHPVPRAVWPVFYSNPAVRDLAISSRWTVSSQKPTERYESKFPLDIRCWLFGGVSKAGKQLPPGTVRGAFATDETCCLTLDELTAHAPWANNCAYFLQADVDRYVVLDIEKTCPPEEAARLLSIPGALFVETSMSGKGYHLLMPPPANFGAFAVARRKRVLKHPKGWWEILLEHWITFTRNVVPEARLAELRALHQGPAPTWEDVWAELASQAKEVASVELGVGAGEVEVEGVDGILAECLRAKPKRGLDHYEGDGSAFEFSVLGFYYGILVRELTVRHLMGIAGPSPDDDEAVVWLLYQLAVRALPYRDKHDAVRDGMPWLHYCAMVLVSRERAAEAVP